MAALPLTSANKATLQPALRGASLKNSAPSCSRCSRNAMLLSKVPLHVIAQAQVSSSAATRGNTQAQYHASDGTIPERVLAALEQALPRVGVDVADPRVSLALSVGAQAGRKIEEGLLYAVNEANKYTGGARRETTPSTWEEALMSVPDLETIPYSVIERRNGVEIRQVESYLVAEVSMTSSQGFDAMGAGRAFNTLADYLFGKNKARKGMEMTTPVVSTLRSSSSQPMEMTTPVISSRRSSGQAMEMTTPVVSTKGSSDSWSMSFVIPREFDESNVPVPDNASVKIRRVPGKLAAASVFSGFVTDDDVARREKALRDRIRQLEGYSVAPGAELEVAQYNPPFTLPWARRNEILLEVVQEDTK